MGEIGDHHHDLRNHKNSHNRRRQKANHRKQLNNNHQRSSSDSSNGNGNKKRKTNNNSKGSHQRCWDWIMVSGTNHYAKNRASFSSYRRVLCRVGQMRVLGIGTVKLQTVRSPDDPRTNTLVLEHVLHTPDAICNGISINPSFMADNHLQITWSKSLVYNEDTDEPLFYGRSYSSKKDSLPRVVLAGDPRGESNLEDDGIYMLNMHASDDELGELDRRVQNQCF